MASGQIVQFRPTVARNMESLTVTNAVQVLSRSLYGAVGMSGGAQEAFLTNYGAALRYTYDNSTSPSASIGHVLPDGGTLVLKGQQQMEAFKCYRLGSVDTVITVSYEYE